MKYILIMVLTGPHAGGIASAEFETLEACRWAQTMFEKVPRPNYSYCAPSK